MLFTKGMGAIIKGAATGGAKKTGKTISDFRLKNQLKKIIQKKQDVTIKHIKKWDLLRIKYGN